MSLDDILGINRRNIDYIMELNKREHHMIVNDKLATKKILDTNNIPSAHLLASCNSFFGIEEFLASVSEVSRFVVKPSKGARGNGIIVVEETREGFWYLSGSIKWSHEKQREHLENILYGICSMDSICDTAFAEELIETHPELGYFTQEGLPDIRFIVYRSKPVASMLRVPTQHSQGKSNLHAGGFALDIDLSIGVTGRGWYCGQYIDNHPETGVPLSGRRIPWWKEIINLVARLPELFPLGYLGIDISIDASKGPLVLELNAQPGLEIQNVTKRGMRSLLGNTL